MGSRIQLDVVAERRFISLSVNRTLVIQPVGFHCAGIYPDAAFIISAYALRFLDLLGVSDSSSFM
jgi:hypothetical protein